jgi:hypothetical protein
MQRGEVRVKVITKIIEKFFKKKSLKLEEKLFIIQDKYQDEAKKMQQFTNQVIIRDVNKMSFREFHGLEKLINQEYKRITK